MTTNHPVDSRTRKCCGAIGAHTPDCDNVPLPPGAHVRVSFSELGDGQRMVASEPVDLESSPYRLFLSALQRLDGSLVDRQDGLNHPEMLFWRRDNLSGGLETLTSAGALELARALVRLAPLLAEWEARAR